MQRPVCDFEAGKAIGANEIARARECDDAIRRERRQPAEILSHMIRATISGHQAVNDPRSTKLS